VLTGSTAGVRPVANPSVGALAYTASKWGLAGLCRQLAATLAEHSIRVNIVHPTGVASGMTMNAAMAEIAAQAMAGDASGIAAMQNAMPVQILQPEDISDAIAFLVSDQAKWITGVSLPVDAGFSIR
jgi:NAD(P)-dependent dehydrogenase (short-subunit alcohol dehydrogenase family)